MNDDVAHMGAITNRGIGFSRPAPVGEAALLSPPRLTGMVLIS